MTAIDTLLVKIMDSISEETKRTLPKKDLKVLLNLSKSVLNPSFITESQSRLLIKILGLHMKKFHDFSEEIDDALKNPSWSGIFRPADETKKIYSKIEKDHTSQIIIESHYSTEIRQVLKEISDIITLSESIKKPKSYTCSLNEKNLVLVVEKLQPLGFEIDENLLNHYNTIKSWSKIEFFSQFSIEQTNNINFLKKINEEIPIESLSNLQVADRSHRFQYFYKISEKFEENLTSSIARRQNTTVWIDKKKFTLADIVKALKELDRFPIMFVFDSHDTTRCLEDLRNLNEILEENEIFDKIGIYFRLDNQGIGKEFNQIISEKKYNKYLDKDTKIVGIQNGKIPKFFIKNDWKPMAVVNLCNYLKNSKTAVFADSCDLIVVHSDREPFGHLGNFKWQ